MIVSFLLLLKHKVRRNFFKLILHGMEWFFIPAAILVLSAIPALDAQTRLMLGRYMDFWVTEKHRNQKR